MEPRLEIVKQIIKEEIERAGLKLLGLKLFGSRARGDFNQSSDWDFYVIVNEDIPHKKKLGITSRIKRKNARIRFIMRYNHSFDFSCK